MKTYIKTKFHWKKTSKRFSFLRNLKRAQNIPLQKHIKISMSQLCQFSIHQNYIQKTHRKNVYFSSTLLRFFIRQNYIETTSIFRPSKLPGRKYVKTTSIFCPSKICQRKYVKTTSFSNPSKLRQRKYVDMTSIFQPLKLHQKMRGNNVETLRYIPFDVST